MTYSRSRQTRFLRTGDASSQINTELPMHPICTETGCYTVRPRPEWGTGPWQQEPDRINFRAWGLPGFIHRHDHFGHWCGYVGVPRSHPAFGRDGDALNIDVHGGLTYAAKSGTHPHLSHPNKGAIWHLGFDCSHFRDYSPGLRLPPQPFPPDPWEHIEDMGISPDQIEVLVDLVHAGRDEDFRDLCKAWGIPASRPRAAMAMPSPSYRTADWVTTETRNLARQLAGLTHHGLHKHYLKPRNPDRRHERTMRSLREFMKTTELRRAFERPFERP